MRNEIEKLAEFAKVFATYDTNIFQRLANGKKVTLSPIEYVKRTEIGYNWYRRLSPDRYGIFVYSHGTLDAVQVVSALDFDEIFFQLYVGSKKYLINQTWFDRLDFEARAFQIDTTTDYNFSMLSVYEILTDLGVS